MEIKGKQINLTSVLSKGIVGAIPFAGPLIAEIIDELIPNKRLERIESLLRLLETKFASLDSHFSIEQFKSDENIDLFEDACIGASRALTQERKEYIASLFVNATTDLTLDYLEAKRLFSLLSELNDVEMIILKYYSLRGAGLDWRIFKEKHKNVLKKAEIYVLPNTERKEKEAIFDSHRTHLVSLGLLAHDFKKIDGIPEIDRKTGMQKSKGYLITTLGRLLIKTVESKPDGS